MDYRVDDNMDVIIPLEKVTEQSELLFQQVRLLLRTWTEDFPYDVNSGMPYDGKILNGDIDATDIQRIYYAKISALEGFGSIENFALSISQDRKISISFDVISLDNQSQTFTQGA
jgi:hypothetical protein